MATRIATQLGWEPKREWVDLTDAEIMALFDANWTADSNYNVFALLSDSRKLLAAIKEKNT